MAQGGLDLAHRAAAAVATAPGANDGAHVVEDFVATMHRQSPRLALFFL